MSQKNELQKEILNRALEELRPEYIAEASAVAGGAGRRTDSSAARKAVIRTVCIAAAAVLLIGLMVTAAVRGDWLRSRYGEDGTDIPGADSGVAFPPQMNAWRDSLDILDCCGEYVGVRVLPMDNCFPKRDNGYAYITDKDGVIQGASPRITIRMEDGQAAVYVEFPPTDVPDTRPSNYDMGVFREIDRAIPLGTTVEGEPCMPELAGLRFRDYASTYGELYVTPEALYFDLGMYWGTLELRQLVAYERQTEAVELPDLDYDYPCERAVVEYLIRTHSGMTIDDLAAAEDAIYAQLTGLPWQGSKEETAALNEALRKYCEEDPVLLLTAIYDTSGESVQRELYYMERIRLYLPDVKTVDVECARPEGTAGYQAMQLALALIGGQ